MRLGALGLVSLLLACEGDTVIEKMDNTAPTVLIVSHSDGASLQEGYIVSFRATASDDNDAVETLSMAWYVGQDLACDWTAVSIGGDQTCDIEITPDMTSVIAEVRDPEGAGGRTEIAIDVIPTEAPFASIESPMQGARLYADQLVELAGVVGDAEDDLADLSIEWSSNQDGVLLEPQPDSSGAISDYVFLSEGQHAIELTVEDASGKRSSDSVVVTVGAANTLPTCMLTEPSDGSAVVVGSSVRFRGVVDDPDIPNDQLQIEWRSDKDGVFGNSSASSDGSVTFSFDGLSTNEHVITMQVQDEVGATCTEQMVLTVGNPPEVQIDAPLDGAVINLNDNVTLQGTVSDTEDALNQLSVEWTSNVDGTLYSGSASSQGSTQTTLNTLSAGQHLITLMVTDSSGLWTDTSIGLTVNTPPPTPGLTLAPSPVYGSDTLTATISPVVDVDGDTVTYGVEWFENGQPTSFTGTSISASELSAGEVWTIRVTPNDGYVDGTPVEASVTVLNSGPSVSNVAISPSTVFTGNTLTCTATATDPDDGMLVPVFDWSINGSPVGTGSTFTVTQVNSNVGDVVTCTATAQDSAMLSASDTASVTIQNAGPTVSNVGIASSGGYYNDQTMTCSANVVDPDESLTPTFEWSDLSGVIASGTTLDLLTTSMMPGDTLTCTVIAQDSSGMTAQSLAQVMIANRSPDAPSVNIAPTAPIPGVDDVTCTASGLNDPDGQTVSVSDYAWTSDMGNVASGPVLSASSISDLETWTCTVTVTDGSLTNVASNSVQAVNVGIDAVTFTTCGQSGHQGPSQSQCDVDYTGTDLAGAVTVSSGVQQWVVPYSGVYTIEAMGAQGGAKHSTVGGSGAYISGEFTLTAGDVLNIVVGQRGTDVTGSVHGGGGGGGSFVFDASNNPLIIAGGGGGTSYQQNAGYGGSSTTSSVGSAYGQSSGGGGGSTDNGGGGGTGAGGGGLYGTGQSNNWAVGGAAAGGIGGTAGYPGYGGFGGGGGSYHGGGGGGGYTGGGGGNYYIGGGGGGSYNAGNNGTAYANYNAGQGTVTISQ